MSRTDFNPSTFDKQAAASLDMIDEQAAAERVQKILHPEAVNSGGIAKVLKASLNAATNDNRQINRDAGRAAMNLIPVASSMIGIRGITSYVASQLPHNAVIDPELER